MIRILEEKIIDGDKREIFAAGTSTDTPPTTDIVTGSVFLAVDTGAVKLFDEESGEWQDA